MTGNAFKTEAVNGKDGYTIVRLPSDTENVAMDADDQKHEYLLWEIMNGSNGM